MKRGSSTSHDDASKNTNRRARAYWHVVRYVYAESPMLSTIVIKQVWHKTVPDDTLYFATPSLTTSQNLEGAHPPPLSGKGKGGGGGGARGGGGGSLPYQLLTQTIDLNKVVRICCFHSHLYPCAIPMQP